MLIEIQDSDQLAALIGASGDKPLLVEVYAHWCRPCKTLLPILEQLAEELQGKAVLCKLDSEQFSAFCEENGIQSVPTLLVYKQGELGASVSGLYARDAILGMLGFS